MRTHYRPVNIGRHSLEHFSMVAGLHILEELLDLIACWVGCCHLGLMLLAFLCSWEIDNCCDSVPFASN